MGHVLSMIEEGKNSITPATSEYASEPMTTVGVGLKIGVPQLIVDINNYVTISFRQLPQSC